MTSEFMKKAVETERKLVAEAAKDPLVQAMARLEEDGVSLESMAHPQDPALIERLCREATRAEGLDPDIETEGLGVLMPRGMRYKLWEVKRPVVQAVLDELYRIDAEMQLNDASLINEVITVAGDPVFNVAKFEAELEKVEMVKPVQPGQVVEIVVRDGETLADACARLGL